MELFKHADNVTRSITPMPGLELVSRLRRKSRAGKETPAAIRRDPSAGALPSLPLELQLMILSRLDLPEIVGLRQVCQYYRNVITADFLQAHCTRWGQIDPVLQGCCSECLTMPGLGRLVLDVTRDHDAWRSICFRCWRTQLTPSYQRKHGPLLELANGEIGYICHFCAWPVCGEGSPENGQELLHAPCRVKRLLATLTWFLMAIIQVGLGVLALVLAVTIYRQISTVLIPTSVRTGEPPPWTGLSLTPPRSTLACPLWRSACSYSAHAPTASRNTHMLWQQN